MFTVIRNVTKRCTVRHLASLKKTCAFSTTPVCKRIIQFENHDDFIKKVFVDSDLPVIVDFHADWFEPCKILTKNLMNEIEPLEDLVLVVVKVEENIDLVHTFEVKAVPAVLVVNNGLVVEKIIGLLEPKIITGLIERISSKQTTE